jgi:hypothetical protein
LRRSRVRTSSLHAEALEQQLGLQRQRRGVALMHHLPGLQNLDAVGDGERAIEILLDSRIDRPRA